MSLLRSSPWNIHETPRDAPSSTPAAPPIAVSRSSSTSCFDSALPWELVACEGSTGEATFVERGAASTSSSVLHCRCTRSQASDVVEQQPLEVSATERLAQEVLPCALCVVCIVYTLLLLQQVRRGMATQPTRSKRPRCATLDSFRGMTLCMMIFVNYGGGGMSTFQHSAWDGMTVADVVFPWFAWIMGFTMRLTASNRNKASGDVSRVLSRCAKLFFIGLFLNNGRNWAEWRIPGVLQALGAGYFICFSLACVVESMIARRSSQASGLGLIVTHCVVAVAPLVLAYLFVTFRLPVPGCPTGYIGPGGDSDGGLYRNCTGGAHLYVDRLVFGETHIYQTPTCQAAFHTGPFDPEGLLNWLMVAATAYLGYIAGILHSNGRSRVKAQLIAGVILFLGATIVSGGFGLVARGIPLNKNLWSLSYVLASSALAHFAFAFLFFFHDDESEKSSFARVGRNPIFLYGMVRANDAVALAGRLPYQVMCLLFDHLCVACGGCLVITLPIILPCDFYVQHEVLRSYVPFAVKPSADVGQPSNALLLLHNVAGVLWWIFVAEWMHARGIRVSV